MTPGPTRGAAPGGGSERTPPGRFGAAELRLALAAPRPAAGLTSEFRLVDGLRTHTRRGGDPGTGPAVVLVHGLAVSHRYLTPLARTLAGAGPVFVPDLPGFGLVITGARDPLVPPRWRDQAARLVPTARAVSVPGAAHNVATTAPGPVAAAIRHLLAPTLER